MSKLSETPRFYLLDVNSYVKSYFFVTQFVVCDMRKKIERFFHFNKQRTY